MQLGQKKVPYCVTHDGRTIRYPDPLIKVNDTIRIDLGTGKITDFIKFDVGNLVMVTGGRNLGRVGDVVTSGRHMGGSAQQRTLKPFLMMPFWRPEDLQSS